MPKHLDAEEVIRRLRQWPNKRVWKLRVFDWQTEWVLDHMPVKEALVHEMLEAGQLQRDGAGNLCLAETDWYAQEERAAIQEVERNGESNDDARENA